MNRRKFISFSSIAASSFVLNLASPRTKPAEALCIICFGGLSTGIGLSSFALGGLALAAFGSGGGSVRAQGWFDRRLEAQLAQRELIRRQFTDISVAETNHSDYPYILGAEREEELGYNPAISFPRLENNYPTIFNVSGAAPIGMSIAAEYLKEQERMTLQEVQDAILPKQRGARTQESSEEGSWNTWRNSGRPTIYPNSYGRFSGVRIKYDAVEPRRGGFGTIDVTVEAHRTITVPQIRVEFA